MLLFTVQYLLCLCPPLVDVILILMKIICFNHPMVRQLGNVCYPGSPVPDFLTNVTWDPTHLLYG